jgi:hypothetical protein
MGTFLAKLSVDMLNPKQWDEWCSNSGAEGIEMHGVQDDGFEHWTITAASKDEAYRMAKRAICGFDVDVRSMTDTDINSEINEQWDFIHSVAGHS